MFFFWSLDIRKKGAIIVVINVILILVANKYFLNLNSGRNVNSCIFLILVGILILEKIFILVGEMLILVEHFNLETKVYSCRKAYGKFLATSKNGQLASKKE